MHLLDAALYGTLTGTVKLYYSWFTPAGRNSRPPMLHKDTHLVYGVDDIDALL